MMSDGNYGLTSGHYTDCNSLLSYPYMAILLPYMVGEGGGEGVHQALYTKMYVMSAILFPPPPWGASSATMGVNDLDTGSSTLVLLS